MTNPDLLLTMTEAEIGREIIRLVPHWYEAQYGPEQYTIPLGSHTARFCNHCRLTPNLRAFLSKISARTQALPLDQFMNLPSLIDVLLESFAIEWLRMHSPTTDWARFIKYLESLARRTYENQPVALNLIIRQGQGLGDITRPRIQKFFDRLASSAFSYLAVDSDLRLIDYGEVEWSQIKAATSYKFHPEFLHPIHSVMDETDFSAHLTTGGDLIIMSKAGLLATRRNRKWKIYDVRTFKNSLAYCLGSHYVGANLFEVVFDLSFRRQGSLLVYDPDYLVAEHILNPESIISSEYRSKAQGGTRPSSATIAVAASGAATVGGSKTVSGPETGQSMIVDSIADISVGRRVGSLRRKRRLIEMSGVDGAVVFDNDGLLAVGALIRSHPNVGNQLGARVTAARSAYLWGGRPIKVSSDGDVAVYFKSRNGDNECDAVMNFL
ncbi:MAG: hypothetical protein ACLP9L_14825 [Thermoguttaceae bacterium]